MAGSRMRRSVPGRTHNKIKRQIYEDILAGIVLVLQLLQEFWKIMRQIYEDILAGIVLVLQLFQEFWKGLQQSEKVVTTPSCEVEGAPEINSHGQVIQQSVEIVTIPGSGVERCLEGSSHGHEKVVSAPACEVESGPEISVHEGLQQSEEQSEVVVTTSDFEVEGSPEISSHGFGHSYSDAKSNENSVFTSDLESVPGVSSKTNNFMNSLPQLPIFSEKHEKMQE